MRFRAHLVDILNWTYLTLWQIVFKTWYICFYNYYRIVPNKRTLRVDKHPDEFRRSRGRFYVFFSKFCSFLTNFCLFWVKYSITKCWGRVYLSRRIYLTLYGIKSSDCCPGPVQLTPGPQATSPSTDAIIIDSNEFLTQVWSVCLSYWP